MNPDQSGPTPPLIVQRADNPPAALGAFIAQELEHWGFGVETDDTATLYIAAGPVLEVKIRQVPDEEIFRGQ